MTLKKVLEKFTWAFLVSVIFSTVLLYVAPDKGQYVLVIITAFILSDIVFSLFVRGGKGIAQIGSETTTKPKGHVFLMFYLAIIASVVLSDIIAQKFIEQNVAPNLEGLLDKFWISIGFSALVYVDMHARLYARKRV